MRKFSMAEAADVARRVLGPYGLRISLDEQVVLEEDQVVIKAHIPGTVPVFTCSSLRDYARRLVIRSDRDGYTVEVKTARGVSEVSAVGGSRDLQKALAEFYPANLLAVPKQAAALKRAMKLSCRARLLGALRKVMGDIIKDTDLSGWTDKAGMEKMLVKIMRKQATRVLKN